MMRTFSFLFSTCLIMSSLMLSCQRNCEEVYTQKMYKPVYMELETARKKVAWEAPRAIQQVGKIQQHGHYLLIAELGKGIHIFDNQNPEAPEALGFLNLPGNREMCWIGNTLYCDNGVDIWAFDMQNVAQLQLVNRMPNALPLASYIADIPIDPTKGVVIGWEESWGKVKYNRCNDLIINENDDIMTQYKPNTKLPAIAPENSAYTTYHAAANWVNYGAYLYVLRENRVLVYQADGHRLTKVRELPATTFQGQAEKLFVSQHYLWVSTTQGTTVLDITHPIEPQYITLYSNLRSCTPFVVDGKYLYVALNTVCGGGLNQLEVIDISKIDAPQTLRIYPMRSPVAMAIYNHYLWLKDAEEGIYVLEIGEDKLRNQQFLTQKPTLQGRDLLSLETSFLSTATDGIYQYQIKDLQNITLLSKITVGK